MATAGRKETILQYVVIVDDDQSHLHLVTEIVDGLRDAVSHPFLSSSAALNLCEGRDDIVGRIDHHVAVTRMRSCSTW
jgi:hypothetical protein